MEKSTEMLVTQHKNLLIQEASNGFYIYKVLNFNTLGDCVGMGDGVDMLFDENEEALWPGTKEFNDALKLDLRANYEIYLNAYFG